MSNSVLAKPQEPSLDLWPLWLRLHKHETLSRGWPSISWSVAELSVQPLPAEEAVCLWLQLWRDERMAYRFNLSAENPRLFVVCEEVAPGQMCARKLTVCQDVAADYMDANQPVLSIPLPAPIAAWMERFMAHHGEVEDPKAGRRRLRTQATRASAATGNRADD